MRVVVDTNVVISGTFFGGNPRKVIEAIVDHRINAIASASMLEEYDETVEAVIRKGYGHFRADGFNQFVRSLALVRPTTKVSVCRDPDDNKFIECAIDSQALYIVSGDKDLLNIKAYKGVEIVTAADFCNRYL